MFTEKKIVEKIKKGELTRDIDEKYAGGYWDLALELVEDKENFSRIERLYNTFWEITEALIE